MTASIVAPVYKSIVRHITDLIEEANLSGTLPPMAYNNWEERAAEASLPAITLLGMEGFSFKENSGRWLINFGLGLSSYKDMNLLLEIEILDWLQREMGEGKKIKLLDMNDGTEVSELVVTDFAIIPMSQSEQRNYRTIGMEIKRTENF